MPQSLHDCIFFLLGTLRLLRIFIFRFMHYAMQNSIGIPSMQVLRNDTSAQKDRIAERLLVLQQELLNRANNREAYDDVAEEIFHLRELQQQTDSDETTKAIQMERIKELQDFIGQQGSELTEFDEKLVKRWLRQITVWDDHYTVELKSGLSIDVPA